jgi:hypothetical protein
VRGASAIVEKTSFFEVSRILSSFEILAEHFGNVNKINFPLSCPFDAHNNEK